MKTKVFLNRIFWVCVALFLSLFCILESTRPLRVSAEKNMTLAFDETNVIDDLEKMTIDGRPFDITDYAFDTTRNVQIISFTEYCYSYQDDKQEYFGLYVYVWNPRGLSFTDDIVRNQIQFTYGEYYDVPDKYPLCILNKCEKSGHEGLFYKLKVVLTQDEKDYILGSLNSVSRTYHVSGIELLESGKTTAKDYSVSATFTYSGFSAGCGPSGITESTLTCTRDHLETLSLDVKHTYFRPDGTNGQNTYTKDVLMTAYFSIPNKVLEHYERLSGVACSWIKVLTDWIYITGREDIYKAHLAHLGSTEWFDNALTLDKDESFEYGFIATSVDGVNVVRCNFEGEHSKENIGRLDYVFWTGSNKADSADTYVLDSDTLMDWMKQYHSKYGKSEDKYLKVDGSYYAPYNAELFALPEASTTNFTVSADEKLSLTDKRYTVNKLQELFGGADLDEENSTEYDNIEGIKMVTAADMNYTSDILCKNLYINENDIAAFQKYYDIETRKGNTVFLIRYDVGSYQSIETRQGKPVNSGSTVGFEDGDTNGYVCRENVYLNFDVIHCEFEKEGETVIIPVVASPVDIVIDTEPPVFTISDDWLNELISWMITIGLVVVLLVAIVALSPTLLTFIGKLLGAVLKILFGLIALPFKLIGKLFKKK